MTGSFERIEVITGIARRRRWSVEEKRRIVAESLRAGASVSLVAQRHGLRSNQLFNEHVVEPAAAAVHGDADTGARQPAGKRGAGELAALIGIEDLGPTEPCQRFIESINAKNATSIVFDSRQASTARLARSMTATR